MPAFRCELEYHTSVMISHIHHTLGVYSYAIETIRQLLTAKEVGEGEVSIQYCDIAFIAVGAKHLSTSRMDSYPITGDVTRS